jgi:hypothetical protein
VSAAVVVTSVFGDAREATVYPGAYDGRDGLLCPFCQSVTVRTDDRWPCCSNPWCTAAALPTDANAGQVRQTFIDHAHAAALAENEARWRADRDRWAREYHRQAAAEREAWTAKQVAEARRRGTCLVCLRPDPYRRVARFVRHRQACPAMRGQ